MEFRILIVFISIVLHTFFQLANADTFNTQDSIPHEVAQFIEFTQSTTDKQIMNVLDKTCNGPNHNVFDTSVKGHPHALAHVIQGFTVCNYHEEKDLAVYEFCIEDGEEECGKLFTTQNLVLNGNNCYDENDHIPLPQRTFLSYYIHQVFQELNKQERKLLFTQILKPYLSGTLDAIQTWLNPLSNYCHHVDRTLPDSPNISPDEPNEWNSESNIGSNFEDNHEDLNEGEDEGQVEESTNVYPSEEESREEENEENSEENSEETGEENEEESGEEKQEESGEEDEGRNVEEVKEESGEEKEEGDEERSMEGKVKEKEEEEKKEENREEDEERTVERKAEESRKEDKETKLERKAKESVEEDKERKEEEKVKENAEKNSNGNQEGVAEKKVVKAEEQNVLNKEGEKPETKVEIKQLQAQKEEDKQQQSSGEAKPQPQEPHPKIQSQPIVEARPLPQSDILQNKQQKEKLKAKPVVEKPKIQQHIIHVEPKPNANFELPQQKYIGKKKEKELPQYKQQENQLKVKRADDKVKEESSIDQNVNAFCQKEIQTTPPEILYCAVNVNNEEQRTSNSLVDSNTSHAQSNTTSKETSVSASSDTTEKEIPTSFSPSTYVVGKTFSLSLLIFSLFLHL